MTSLNARMSIRQHISSGRIAEAIELISQEYPAVRTIIEHQLEALPWLLISLAAAAAAAVSSKHMN